MAVPVGTGEGCRVVSVSDVEIDKSTVLETGSPIVRVATILAAAAAAAAVVVVIVVVVVACPAT